MSFETRLTEARNKFAYIKHDVEFKRGRKKELEEQVEELSEKRTFLKKVDAGMEELVRRRTRSSVKQIEDLVNQGLSTIFETSYQFQIETITKRSNMHYEFFLYDGGKKKKIMNSKGGGVISIISLILRIVVILLLGLKPFLVLDESLAQLSTEYTDAAATFFKDLGKKLGFYIVMVSHNHSYGEYGDTVYKIKKIGKYASFERIK